MHIASKRKCNGRWRKNKFNQCCIAGDQRANWSECFVCVCKWSACMRYGGSKFSETKNTRDVQNCNKQSSDQKANCSCNAPAIVPSEIFAADYKTNRNC